MVSVEMSMPEKRDARPEAEMVAQPQRFGSVEDEGDVGDVAEGAEEGRENGVEDGVEEVMGRVRKEMRIRRERGERGDGMVGRGWKMEGRSRIFGWVLRVLGGVIWML